MIGLQSITIIKQNFTDEGYVYENFNFWGLWCNSYVCTLIINSSRPIKTQVLILFMMCGNTRLDTDFKSFRITLTANGIHEFRVHVSLSWKNEYIDENGATKLTFDAMAS